MIESKAIKSKLTQIDKVKARGVGDHISLPQLVVCGDQSAGKSSVLEGITEIPFPRKDGLCTRFATEIILRHSPGEQEIKASIIPHTSRDEITANKLRTYRKHLSAYDELPGIIQEVGALMGLRGFTDVKNAPPFASDVLRIEVIGETGLHLTVVDLPGLVSGADNDENLMVEALVNSYLDNSRTVILAVIPAGNDVETQPIIRAARSFDKEGIRTVGIITKADLINDGTEDRVASVVNNLGVIKLKLGFFLLKNPSPKELDAGITPAERKEQEHAWFQRRCWKDQHLNSKKNELPKVRSEICQLLSDAREQLADLGGERPDILSQRLFLSNLSMDIWNLTKSGAGGSYQGVHSNFFNEKEMDNSFNRVRASVHFLNSEFAQFMRTRGHQREVTKSKENTDEGTATTISESTSPWGSPKKVSQTEFDSWVMQVYMNTRGLELSGTYGHTLLMELFHDQSSRWSTIAHGHTTKVHRRVRTFVQNVLEYVVKEDHVRNELRHVIEPSLQANLDAALAELQKICDDEKIQPITYNHYFTDNVQKSRHQEMKDRVQDVFTATSVVTPANPFMQNSERSRLLDSLQTQITVDIDKQACEEVKTALKAYYKVAMKTFVDNVCRQVIERHVISKLPGIFHPTSVVKLSDEEVARIAAEPDNKTEQRKGLFHLIQILSGSLRDLQG